MLRFSNDLSDGPIMAYDDDGRMAMMGEQRHRAKKDWHFGIALLSWAITYNANYRPGQSEYTLERTIKYIDHFPERIVW